MLQLPSGQPKEVITVIDSVYVINPFDYQLCYMHPISHQKKNTPAQKIRLKYKNLREENNRNPKKFFTGSVQRENPKYL